MAEGSCTAATAGVAVGAVDAGTEKGAELGARSYWEAESALRALDS